MTIRYYYYTYLYCLYVLLYVHVLLPMYSTYMKRKELNHSPDGEVKKISLPST